MNIILKSYRKTKTTNTTTMIITAHAPTDPPIAIGKGSTNLFGKISTNIEKLM